MEKAIEEYKVQQQRKKAIDQLLQLRKKMPPVSHKKSTNAINLLYAMQINTRNGLGIYELASHLSAKHQQHMFDTLYHSQLHSQCNLG